MATIEEIYRIIKKKWEEQGVKHVLQNERPVWVKTLRTAECTFCGRQEVEKEIDQGYRSWAILPYLTDARGFSPEVCPDCLKQKVGQKLEAKPPRIIRCVRCGAKQQEKIFGIGWPGWQPTHLGGVLCPNCFLDTALLLGEKYVRGTWTDLTYPFGSLLTSTKMTQNQDNFTALAEGHTGAPVIDHGILGGLADDDHTQYYKKSGDILTGNMNFNQNQAVGLVIENRTSDPSSPIEGQIWIRTDI